MNIWTTAFEIFPDGAKGEAAVAAGSVDHLTRYLELLFEPQKNQQLEE